MAEQSWKPDYNQEWINRAFRAQAMLGNPEVSNWAMLHYKNNPIDWIEDWCITYDPRKPYDKSMPFLLFPRQKELVQFLMECIRDKEGGLIEKCRDMGASWICVALSVHQWLFIDGTAIGWGSRKQDLVDRLGVPDSIFEKMRMIIRELPVWMLPPGFKYRQDMPEMKIVNRDNGAVISGESGDNIGRGGRSTVYFKDESAHYEHPETIEAALGDNTDVQIDISSVNGSGNVFYRRRMAGEEWHPGKVMPVGVTRVFVMDWRDHPLKTQEWYDQRRKRYEREGILHLFAQEVDRDYSATQVGIIIPQIWVKAAIDAHMKIPGLAAHGEKIAAQDVADGGGDKNALAIRNGLVLRFCDHWSGDAGEAASIALPHCIEHGVTELYYDSIGVGAGFKTGINNLNDNGAIPASLRVQPWLAGAPPLNPEDHMIPGDINSPTNEIFFKNLKAQAWWNLRTRFYKTYRVIVHGDVYPVEELISLSSEMENLHQLCRELSQATRKYTTDGKLLVDKNPDGTPSPNLADSVVMVYTPTRELSIFDVL